MSFAILHSTKGSSSGGGLGNHIDRVEGKEHTYPDADPTRANLNWSWKPNEHSKKPMYEAIKNRVKEGYTGKRKIRSDAVTNLTHILSGSHEQMKAIEKDPELFKKWVKKNADWAAKEFGKENIVRFVLHRDEKTAHIHLVTVPITADGRLSAKEVMGNRKVMTERQTSYAEAMKEFGLERGVSSNKHYVSMNQLKAEQDLEELQEKIHHLYNLRDEARDKLLDLEAKNKAQRELYVTQAMKSIPKLEKQLSELKKGIEKEAKKKDKGWSM